MGFGVKPGFKCIFSQAWFPYFTQIDKILPVNTVVRMRLCISSSYHRVDIQEMVVPANIIIIILEVAWLQFPNIQRVFTYTQILPTRRM